MMADSNEEESKINRRNSGDTSVDSQMEDTPSNYNIANQRFDHNHHKDIDYNVEKIQEEE